MKENYRIARLTGLIVQIIQPNAPRMAIKFHLVTDRGMRPLGAVHALAHGAADANRLKETAARGVKLICIGKILCMVDFTTKRNREFRR